jgi:hypothetical protein
MHLVVVIARNSVANFIPHYDVSTVSDGFLELLQRSVHIKTPHVSIGRLEGSRDTKVRRDRLLEVIPLNSVAYRCVATKLSSITSLVLGSKKSLHVVESALRFVPREYQHADCIRPFVPSSALQCSFELSLGSTPTQMPLASLEWAICACLSTLKSPR